jgi:hypothetical protein
MVAGNRDLISKGRTGRQLVRQGRLPRVKQPAVGPVGEVATRKRYYGTSYTVQIRKMATFTIRMLQSLCGTEPKKAVSVALPVRRTRIPMIADIELGDGDRNGS